MNIALSSLTVDTDSKEKYTNSKLSVFQKKDGDIENVSKDRRHKRNVFMENKNLSGSILLFYIYYFIIDIYETL